MFFFLLSHCSVAKNKIPISISMWSFHQSTLLAQCLKVFWNKKCTRDGIYLWEDGRNQWYISHVTEFLSNQGTQVNIDVFLPKNNSKSSLGFIDAINSAFWSHKTRVSSMIKVQDEHRECFNKKYFKSMRHRLSLKTWPKDCSVRIFKGHNKVDEKLCFQGQGLKLQ